MTSSETVLVTGAAGFIGSAVVHELHRQGRRVIALDALLDGLYPADEKKARFETLANLPSVEAFHLDLRSDDLSVLPTNITHVINEAAMPGLGLSWNDFDLYSSCNLIALARLIDASSRWELARFVQISTSSVYGKNAIGDENQPVKPVSPYGVTKLAAENLLLAHLRDSGFPGLILRYFSVYGPGQRPDMAYRRFIDRALAGEEITLYGSGEQSRSNTYIDDCVAATISALHAGEPGDIFNIAGGEERTINEALGIIEGILGEPLKINRQPAARGDQARTKGDSSEATKVLGFRHTTRLEEGLARQIAWQKGL
jgi:nucleoside-diphosphate-sugar epimerase